MISLVLTIDWKLNAPVKFHYWSKIVPKSIWNFGPNLLKIKMFASHKTFSFATVPYHSYIRGHLFMTFAKKSKICSSFLPHTQLSNFVRVPLPVDFLDWYSITPFSLRNDVSRFSLKTLLMRSTYWCIATILISINLSYTG